MTIEQQKTARILAELTAIVQEDDFLAEIIKLSGCHYTSGSAVFGVWAPAVNQEQTLVLNIANPTNEREYAVSKYTMQRVKDFFVLAVSGLTPFIAPGKGDLYFYTFPEHEEIVPDIYSYYQPFGLNAPSAIIDQQYAWHDAQYARRKPVSITKLHIGTASAGGDFAGLQKELTENPYFAATDAIEFLPVGAFPGRGWQTVLADGKLTVTKTGKQKPINWGYDSGPNFIVSVSEAYGTPAQLKSLIDAARERGIKVGLDIQFNHFGPEGVFQNFYSREYISQDNTEWGYRPNFKNNYVRQFMLGKLKEFCQLYRPDYLRLDMSSRYGDDEFIAEICHLLPDMSVVLEDERHKAWLTDKDGAGALAQWSFSAVHDLQKLRNGNKDVLPGLLEKLASAQNRVIFANSHDEQGNNDARPVADKLTTALAVLSNGIEMSWYGYGWFHFFCNYADDIQLVMVTAEKSGVIFNYPAELWSKMTALHPYFPDIQVAREFYSFINRLWRAEIAPFRSDVTRCRHNVQVWINNNAMLVELCLAYNQMIFDLANAQNFIAPDEYMNFIKELKSLRKKNSWMYGADCYYNIDRENKTLSMLNIDLTAKKAVRLTYTFGAEESLKIREIS